MLITGELNYSSYFKKKIRKSYYTPGFIVVLFTMGIGAIEHRMFEKPYSNEDVIYHEVDVTGSMAQQVVG